MICYFPCHKGLGYSETKMSVDAQPTNFPIAEIVESAVVMNTSAVGVGNL